MLGKVEDAPAPDVHASTGQLLLLVPVEMASVHRTGRGQRTDGTRGSWVPLSSGWSQMYVPCRWGPECGGAGDAHSGRMSSLVVVVGVAGS